MELNKSLTLLKHIDLKTFDDSTPISSTALIELILGGEKKYYFLLPAGGGSQVDYQGKIVHVITPKAPLGKALLLREVGDEIEVQIGGNHKEFVISAVW